MRSPLLSDWSDGHETRPTSCIPPSSTGSCALNADTQVHRDTLSAQVYALSDPVVPMAGSARSLVLVRRWMCQAAHLPPILGTDSPRVQSPHFVPHLQSPFTFKIVHRLSVRRRDNGPAYRATVLYGHGEEECVGLAA